MPKTTKKSTHVVTLPQYRCLKALAGSGRPTMTRLELAAKAGFRPGSGTISRALNGSGKSYTAGKPIKGLLSLGFLESLVVGLDGDMTETRYRATPAGIRAIKVFVAANGKPRKVPAAGVHTNARYQIN